MLMCVHVMYEIVWFSRFVPHHLAPSKNLHFCCSSAVFVYIYMCVCVYFLQQLFSLWYFLLWLNIFCFCSSSKFFSCKKLTEKKSKLQGNEIHLIYYYFLSFYSIGCVYRIRFPSNCFFVSVSSQLVSCVCAILCFSVLC